MYSKNIITFLQHLLGKDGATQPALPINVEDEITRETLLTRGGAVVHPRVLELTREGVTVGEIDLWSMAFVFVLATFVGFYVIQNVSRLLHTPLMSLTNAISAIAVVGSIIIAGEQKTVLSTVLGAVAVAASVTNIVSGFLITDRMLKMFRERGAKR
jgi:NAD(P) transhydrogenase subunit alpha